MSSLKVSAIAHPSAASTAFTLNSDGSVTLGPSVNLGGFPAGTAMLFVQTNAPTGWTKSTTHNDKALRVVNGAASSGGSSGFSTVFNGSVDSTTLTTSQIPSHSHTYNHGTSLNTGGGLSARATSASGTFTTNAEGGGGSHTHTMNVAYVDVIIATKD